MKTTLTLLITIVLFAGCTSQQKVTLEQVKIKVSQMKTDVKTVEMAYRADGQIEAADRMAGYIEQLEKLAVVLDSDLPGDKCESVQMGFDEAIKELIDGKEKPEYVILAVMFRNIVEGYVCEVKK